MKKFLHFLQIVVPVFFTFLVGNAFGQTTKIFNTAGSAEWIAPCNVTSITVEVWGAGGAGQGTGVAGKPSAGGGGSGGGFVKTNYKVIPGNSYALNIGTAGSGETGSDGESSWFVNASTIKAVGGKGAGPKVITPKIYGAGATAPLNGNIGGALASSYGGNGATATSVYSGGGGSSAGNVTGNSASGSTGGVAPANGYNGANGRTNNGFGADGGFGAGGSGAKKGSGDADNNGGDGGLGRVLISYTTPCVKDITSTVEPITTVTFAGINNTTSNLTSSPKNEVFCLTAEVTLGNSFGISLKGNTNGSYTNYLIVYIDWDQDGSYGNNTNEIYNVGTIVNSTGIDAVVLTGSVNVPATAALGLTRMRVVKNYNSSGDACSSISFGQTEDYSVNVKASVSCIAPTVQPTALVLTPSTTSVTGSFTPSATANGYLIVRTTSATGPTDPTSGTTYAAGVNALGGRIVQSSSVTTFTDTPLTNGTPYWYWVFAYNSACTGQPAYRIASPLTNNTTTTTVVTYCIPTSTYAVDGTGITNISYSTVNNTTSNKTTYNDYTALSGTAIQGSSLPLSVTTATAGYSYNLKVWIDWNNDGDFFDTGEEMYSGSVNSTTITPSLAIPVAATIGNHRMRIGIVYGSTPAPCIAAGWSQFEDYTLNITAAAACTGKPVIVTNPSNVSIANGANTTFASTFSNSPATISPTSFTWEVSNDGGANYITITNGGVYSTSNTKILTITGSTASMNSFKYRVYGTNACGTSNASDVATLTVNTTYCPSTSSVPSSYINGITSVGTLNDVANTSTGHSTNGYGNYSAITIAKQVPGGGININIDLTGRMNAGSPPIEESQFIKAYVDWNGDGDFNDPGEIVYTTGRVATGDTSFGFVVPPTQGIGNYKMRIRTTTYTEGESTGTYGSFDACATANDFATGETEDYTITVVADCASKIINVTDGTACGAGSVVILRAEASVGATGYKWYAAETGGSILATTLTGSWTTGALAATTIYYVTSTNGSCESLVRTAVKATINPTTNITFTPTVPAACGENNIVAVEASGDTQVVDLFNENFDGATIGFTITTPTNIYDSNNSGGINTGDGPNAAAPWSVKNSTYQPETTAVWKPAINSGTNGDKFAFTTSDFAHSNVVTQMSSTTSMSTIGYNDLFLTLKYYYSYYSGDSGKVQISTDGGSTYATVKTYNSDLGSASKFADDRIDLSAYVGNTSVKIRFEYTANWDDGWAIDDVRIYGTQNINTAFKYDTTTVDAYSDSNATIPYISGTPAAKIWLKPSATQLEGNSSFIVPVSATLSNGCIANGSVLITNNTKYWEPTIASTDWNSTTSWKPNSSIPTAEKCVIIKSEVILGAGAEGFAKNVKVEAGGKLTINSLQSLIVKETFTNSAAEGDVMIESDGNLIQKDDVISIQNTGAISAKRIINIKNNKEYNYLISPLIGTNLKTDIYEKAGIYSNAPSTLYHVESNNRFLNSSGTYIQGRGLAVKEPVTETGVLNALFKGVPMNGAFSYALANSNTGNNTNLGYNLIGNPYPSNIDLVKLYTLNNNESKIYPTFYFWDNTVNTVYIQAGSGYSGAAYAVFNASTGTYGTGNGAGFLTQTTEAVKAPTFVAKVGQGFMVKSSEQIFKILDFSNDIRIGNPGIGFFGNTTKGNRTVVDDRFWLNLSAPTNITTQVAIVYFDAGNNEFAKDDSELNGSPSDALYTLIGDRKVIINGRSTFVNTDQIPLGANSFSAGNYTYSLGNKEGAFANNQNIYLKDKQTGIVTNLSEGSYTFAENAGASTGRFEIIYRPEIVLVTDTKVKEGIIVYRDHDDFIIKSPKMMSVIQVYDASGKLIIVLKPNGKQEVLDVSSIANGMYLLKITTTDGQVNNKKISR